MTRHHAGLVAVAIASVSFSTPITAQQEPTPPPTMEARVETLGGGGWSGAWLRKRTGGGYRTLVGDQITDAGLVQLSELTGLKSLVMNDTVST